MTTSETTFIARLPLGYTVREIRKITPAGRKTWNDVWDRMLVELHDNGGYAWQSWGNGHQSSGIVRAVESRGMIEVAESKGRVNLMRLTPRGMSLAAQVSAGLAEEGRFGAKGEIPAGAPAQRERRELSPDDEHLFTVLADERSAVRDSLARLRELRAGGDLFVAVEDLDRLVARENHLSELLRGLR